MILPNDSLHAAILGVISQFQGCKWIYTPLKIWNNTPSCQKRKKKNYPKGKGFFLSEETVFLLFSWQDSAVRSLSSVGGEENKERWIYSLSVEDQRGSSVNNSEYHPWQLPDCLQLLTQLHTRVKKSPFLLTLRHTLVQSKWERRYHVAVYFWCYRWFLYWQNSPSALHSHLSMLF